MSAINHRFMDERFNLILLDQNNNKITDCLGIKKRLESE